MNEVEEQRFLRLIEHLETIPAEQFDFGTVTRQTACGTVCCAIGWTPTLFPDLVQRTYIPGEFMDTLGLRLTGEGGSGFARVGSKLFGLTLQVAHCLFFPNQQKRVNASLDYCGRKAAPTEVAAMLRQYLALYPTRPCIQCNP